MNLIDVFRARRRSHTSALTMQSKNVKKVRLALWKVAHQTRTSRRRGGEETSLFYLPCLTAESCRTS